MALAKKIQQRHYRHKRISAKISGNTPRLIVFRSLKHNYVQLIDPKTKKVITSVSDLKIEKGKKTEKAKQVGLLIAQRALKLNIKEIAFDRSGYKYTGRAKAIGDGAREGGLKF